ncbi:MAG: O-antigen ligase family protein [Bacteroidota bacterium]
MKLENTLSGRKITTAMVYSGLLIATVGIALAIAKFGTMAGFLIIVGLIGVPVAIFTVSDLRLGTLLLITIAFFLARISHFYLNDAPVGITLDALILLMIIGLVANKSKRGDFHLATTPLSYVVWLWLIYNAFEFFNPMQDKQAWVYVIRSTAGHMIFYFLVKEAFNDIKYFRKFMILWVGLSFIGACYGLFQKFHGLLDSELHWVMSDEMRFKLYFNWGVFRVFSYFNDPTVFGILMAFTGLFCITLAMGPLKLWMRGLLVFMGGMMLLSVVYTGTRTAYVMLPAGFGFFALITVQVRTIIFSGILFLIAAFIIFSDIKSVGPLISTSGLERIRSAFKPKDDPSYQVRLQNQAMIKPFIHSHPFGGGLGSIGGMGERFNPNSPLAGFDADSSYVKFAVELGWVGLAIFCLLQGVALITGIRAYYKVKDPEIKIYLACLTSVVFSIVVANFPQMATIQLPNAFLFYALLAFIDKMADIDAKQNSTK